MIPNPQKTLPAESLHSGRKITNGAGLARINTELLLLGTDHVENIRRLTALFGELLGATCAMYNCLENGLLCSLTSWQAPAGYNPKDRPDGHICYDVIRKAGEQVFVIRDLQNSHYVQTDPNVLKHNLHTYVGKAVKSGGVYLGSLCAVFQKDFSLSSEQEQFVCLLSSLVGREEERRREYEKLLRAESLFQSFVENHYDAVCRWTPEMVLVFTNPSFNLMFGGGAKSLVGRRWIDLVSADRRSEMENYYAALVANPRVDNHERSAILPDGKKHLLQWIDIPLFDKEGNVVEFQSICRDFNIGEGAFRKAGEESHA